MSLISAEARKRREITKDAQEGGREVGREGVSANEEGAGRNILLSQHWGNNGLSRLLNRADPLKLRWGKKKGGNGIHNMFPAV